MDKIVQNQLELKTVTNYFLNKLFYSIEKDDRSKIFREIIQFLVGLRDNNRYRSFEIEGLMI